MSANMRAYTKLLNDMPHVKHNKRKEYLEILWKIRTNGYLKPINYGGK